MAWKIATAKRAAASDPPTASQTARILELEEENRRLLEHYNRELEASKSLSDQAVRELEEENQRLREHAHAAV